MRCREEPPRLLGSRFQERFFLLRGRYLLLLKEKKVRHWDYRAGMLSDHVAGAITILTLTLQPIFSLVSCFPDDFSDLVITCPNVAMTS